MPRFLAIFFRSISWHKKHLKIIFISFILYADAKIFPVICFYFIIKMPYLKTFLLDPAVVFFVWNFDSMHLFFLVEYSKYVHILKFYFKNIVLWIIRKYSLVGHFLLYRKTFVFKATCFVLKKKWEIILLTYIFFLGIYWRFCSRNISKFNMILTAILTVSFKMLTALFTCIYLRITYSGTITQDLEL